MAGKNEKSLFDEIKNQSILGDASFVHQLTDSNKLEALSEIPKSQRRSLALSLAEYKGLYNDRDEAMARAYASGVYTMKEIGDFFSRHYQSVIVAVRKFE